MVQRKIYKTRRYRRDVDQVFEEDLASKDSIQKLENQPIDETKPGLGQFYCVPCAKYFETETAKSTHLKAKVHKRRIKNLRFGPYTIEEANAAAGLDVLKFLKKQEEQKRKIELDRNFTGDEDLPVPKEDMMEAEHIIL